jgi:hypothetical protein
MAKSLLGGLRRICIVGVAVGAVVFAAGSPALATYGHGGGHGQSGYGQQGKSHGKSSDKGKSHGKSYDNGKSHDKGKSHDHDYKHDHGKCKPKPPVVHPPVEPPVVEPPVVVPPVVEPPVVEPPVVEPPVVQPPPAVLDGEQDRDVTPVVDSAADEGGLPVTGASVTGLLLGGMLLIAVGMAALRIARRTRGGASA